MVDDDPVTKVHGAYAYGDVIGRGGMGEVILAHDKRIGRDVAVKRLRATAPSEDEIGRFLREARIQARLDHPAIVPVYELSRDEAGRPFFTMKRLAGTPLADMISSPMPTRQRLLRAFADVCRAIDFAHSRGVVHRDLKPGNIVLGEFGDVYVLDWGVARVVDDAVTELFTADIDTIEGTAPEGHVLGTPGYMAPEQLRAPDVARAADVYALGAILFELLAGEPLHPRGHAAIASTLADHDGAPSHRRPDRSIAPELDALCAAMLAIDPALRPSTRRVADRIEDYLDGDRDVARRRTLANDLVWSARAAYDDHRRGDAMRLAARALAIDPEVPGAGELMTTMMLEPPAVPPPELAAALAAADHDLVRRRARAGIIAYLAMSAFLPIAMWNGIRRWDVILTIFGFSLMMAGAAWQLRRRPDRSFAEMVAYALGNAVLLVLLGRMAGPFTFVPALACFMVMSVMSYPAFVRRPWVLVLAIVTGFLGPVAAELLGWLPKTWEIRDGSLVSHAGALVVEGQTAAMVVFASVVTIVIGGVHAATVAIANRRAQHLLVTQAWTLRQLLPEAPAEARIEDAAGTR